MIEATIVSSIGFVIVVVLCLAEGGQPSNLEAPEKAGRGSSFVYTYCGLCTFLCLLTQDYCRSCRSSGVVIKRKINTFGTRVQNTETVCHHTGASLHGYGKLGCSWKVCLPQTLLCALITALRACCPAVSGGTAAGKAPVSKHATASAERR